MDQRQNSERNRGEKTSMLQVNETAQTFDLGELLQSEVGIFEAISPRGDKYQVLCRQGQSIVSIKPASAEHQRSQWRVRKIAELQLTDPQQQPA